MIENPVVGQKVFVYSATQERVISGRITKILDSGMCLVAGNFSKRMYNRMPEFLWKTGDEARHFIAIMDK